MKKIFFFLILILSISKAYSLPIRIIVLVTESKDYYYDSAMASTSIAITRVLLENKITVIDQNQFNLVKNREMINSTLTGDIKSAISLAAAFNADAIIVGNARSNKNMGIDLGSLTVRNFTATTNVKAIASSTGQVLAVASGQSIAPSLNHADGKQAALTAAGENAAMKLIPALKRLSFSGNTKQLIQITIKNVNSFSDAISIIKELKSHSLIKTADRRNFTGGVLKIDLTAKSSTDEVAALLESLQLVKLRVSSVDNNAILALAN